MASLFIPKKTRNVLCSYEKGRALLAQVRWQFVRNFSSSFIGAPKPSSWATVENERLPILGSLAVGANNDSRSCQVTIVHENTSARQALALLMDDPNLVLVYRGTFGQGQQLLAAVQRRLRNNPRHDKKLVQHETVTEQWLALRQYKLRESHCLNRFLVQVNQPHHDLVDITKSPAHISNILREAAIPESCAMNYSGTYLLSLREINARVGSYQWRTKGVWVDALQNTIHPHFNVYPPTRQEYLALLPHQIDCCTNHDSPLLMDIGTGTGILTAIMLHRQPSLKAVATDTNPLAVACARDNFQRLGIDHRVTVQQTNLFPDTNVPADVLVCNPPWIPEVPVGGLYNSSDSMPWLDQAIYDTVNTNGQSMMLHGFLQGARQYMRCRHSQVWLILSDLAEHLNLRSQEELDQWIHDGGLTIIQKRQATRVGSIGPLVRRSFTKPRLTDEERAFPLVAEARVAERTFVYILTGIQ